MPLLSPLTDNSKGFLLFDVIVSFVGSYIKDVSLLLLGFNIDSIDNVDFKNRILGTSGLKIIGLKKG